MSTVLILRQWRNGDRDSKTLDDPTEEELRDEIGTMTSDMVVGTLQSFVVDATKYP